MSGPGLNGVKLTREQLYERVWAKPMIHAAAEFGISGNGLAKICDRLAVPYPPRGYWAKKQAGKKVVTYRLPDRGETTPADVFISPTPPPVAPAALSGDLQAEVESVRAEMNSFAVPEKLMRPHAVIAGWLAERIENNRRARQERGEWRIYSVREWTELDHRQHRILDALFKAL